MLRNPPSIQKLFPAKLAAKCFAATGKTDFFDETDVRVVLSRTMNFSKCMGLLAARPCRRFGPARRPPELARRAAWKKRGHDLALVQRPVADQLAKSAVIEF
jgi:hypothetical protein